MINKLQSYTSKSFFNYSGPVDGFCQKNIIFGYNGCGKSSLAKGLVEQYGRLDNRRLFNREYVKNNLLLENDNSKIQGVRAVFGEQQVTNVQQIKELNAQLKDEKSYQKSIDESENKIRLLIDSKHDQKKGSLSINRKQKNADIKRVIDLYKTDITAAKKIQPNENILKEYKGDNSLEKELASVESIVLENIVFADEDKMITNNAVNFLDQEFADVLIPSSIIVKWLNDGVDIHQKEKKCQFCGGNIDLDNIRQRVELYNLSEKQKATLAFSKVIKALNNWIEKIDKFNSKMVFLDKVLSKEKIKALTTFTEDVANKTKQIIEKFELKLQNMDVLVQINQDEISLLFNGAEQVYNEVIEKIQGKKQELNILINKQSTLVRGAIGLSIVQDNGIQMMLKQLENDKGKYNQVKESNEAIKQKIIELENQSSNFSDFSKLVNTILKNNEVNLRINLATDDEDKSYYWIGHSVTNEILSIEDISEGEKNLLALLFFFYELYEDEEQESLKRSIELIVLDDPISSLDDSNRFFVIELVKRLLRESTPQIFVLTHVWNDFCQLIYGLPKDNSNSNVVGKYEVYKDIAAKSDLRIINSAVKPYKKLFEEVYQLSQKNFSDELTNCDIYHSCNSMRRVFEEFLQFKTGNSILPQKSYQAKIECLICNSLNVEKISGTKRNKLGKFLEVINVLSHTNRRSQRDIIESARFMINLIQEIDRGHYLSMIN
ncbi:AAA family ATPase [Enterococcus avium]|uniref:AAA family ATPase n=1 Tax=Enterococcus avium TaxID=33945 RepID=UPI003D137C81